MMVRRDLTGTQAPNLLISEMPKSKVTLAVNVQPAEQTKVFFFGTDQQPTQFPSSPLQQTEQSRNLTLNFKANGPEPSGGYLNLPQ